MDLKIARNGFLAPNPAFLAIFTFFGFFNTSVALKYKKIQKTDFENFLGIEN